MNTDDLFILAPPHSRPQQSLFQPTSLGLEASFFTMAVHIKLLGSFDYPNSFASHPGDSSLPFSGASPSTPSGALRRQGHP
ncbi:hypothetical protein CTheo_174 [Ceratobasidium theobromae]|uniref:Uncharacterized protein n=1 Tax=Ceratobasidium theobromae TaxID=1582974 RepID=A0A5N5R1M2_9AGAM|nr:hypothetical protein CTheo_174 [Ceratobasidium theobromae]